MAKLLLFYLIFFVALSFIVICSATTYIVGDNSGWDISSNLDTWVKDKRFMVGDALVFQYSSAHGVDEVTRENFNKCNTTNVLRTYGNGNTTVPLTKPGDRYFVCSNELHCLGGMKLHVHIEDDEPYSPAPAPSMVAGVDQGPAAALSRPPPSSKKNTPISNGAVNWEMESFHLVNIVLLAIFFSCMLKI